MSNTKIFKRLLYNGSVLLRQEKPVYKLGKNKTQLAYRLRQDQPPSKLEQDKPTFKLRKGEPPFKLKENKPAYKLRQDKTESARKLRQDKPAYYKDTDRKRNWESGTMTKERLQGTPHMPRSSSRSSHTKLLRVSGSNRQSKEGKEGSFTSEAKNNFSRKHIPSLLDGNYANKEEAEMLSTAAVTPSRRVNKTSLVINRVVAEKMLLYKDDDIVVLNKPSGLAVHSGPRMKDDLSHYLRYWQYGSPDLPQLAHRLDKDTSGILLLTRHTEAARRLAKMFQERTIIKKYWAVTVNVPCQLQGSVKIPLAVKNIATSTAHRRHSMNRVVLRQDKMLGNSLSSGEQVPLTEYKVLCVSQQAPRRCCLLEVKPVTGFKHQIRVHLADGLMCPILGDYKFAGPLFRSSEFLKMKMKALNCFRGPLHLHAREIIIPNYYVNNGKPLIIQATPPGHFVRTANLQGLELGP